MERKIKAKNGDRVSKQKSSWTTKLEKGIMVKIWLIQQLLEDWRNILDIKKFLDFTWLWTTFQMKINSLRIRLTLGQSAKKNLMSWVGARVPTCYLQNPFPQCLLDGIVLCALVERLVHGSCPRFDVLDPEQRLRNLKLALYLVTKHLHIKPEVSAEAILSGGRSVEKNLLLLLAQIKMVSEKQNLFQPSYTSRSLEHDSDEAFDSHQSCCAKGMGLLLAVQGRKACFSILMKSTEYLDMVIEIRGPKNTACSKRIANVRSLSKGNCLDVQNVDKLEIYHVSLRKEIPLTYKILGQKICVGYTPLENGKHHMSIIWQGQHIKGSPYVINVDKSIDILDNDIQSSPKSESLSFLKCSDSVGYDESIKNPGEESNIGSAVIKKRGRIIRKKVLRYIVKIGGNDVVIDDPDKLCEVINSLKEQSGIQNDESGIRNSVEINGRLSERDVSITDEPKTIVSTNIATNSFPCQQHDIISINGIGQLHDESEKSVGCQNEIPTIKSENQKGFSSMTENMFKNESPRRKFINDISSTINQLEESSHVSGNNQGILSIIRNTPQGAENGCQKLNHPEERTIIDENNKSWPRDTLSTKTDQLDEEPKITSDNEGNVNIARNKLQKEPNIVMRTEKLVQKSVTIFNNQDVSSTTCHNGSLKDQTHDMSRNFNNSEDIKIISLQEHSSNFPLMIQDTKASNESRLEKEKCDKNIIHQEVYESNVNSDTHSTTVKLHTSEELQLDESLQNINESAIHSDFKSQETITDPGEKNLPLLIDNRICETGTAIYLKTDTLQISDDRNMKIKRDGESNEEYIKKFLLISDDQNVNIKRGVPSNEEHINNSDINLIHKNTDSYNKLNYNFYKKPDNDDILPYADIIDAADEMRSEKHLKRNDENDQISENSLNGDDKQLANMSLACNNDSSSQFKSVKNSYVINKLGEKEILNNLGLNSDSDGEHKDSVLTGIDNSAVLEGNSYLNKQNQTHSRNDDSFFDIGTPTSERFYENGIIESFKIETDIIKPNASHEVDPNITSVSCDVRDSFGDKEQCIRIKNTPMVNTEQAILKIQKLSLPKENTESFLKTTSQIGRIKTSKDKHSSISPLEHDENYKGHAENEAFRNSLSLFACDHDFPLYNEHEEDLYALRTTSGFQARTLLNNSDDDPVISLLQRTKDSLDSLLTTSDNIILQNSKVLGDDKLNDIHSSELGLTSYSNKQLQLDYDSTNDDSRSLSPEIEEMTFEVHKNDNDKNDQHGQRKRFSWSDKSLLPCIRESSIESLADSDEVRDSKVQVDFENSKSPKAFQGNFEQPGEDIRIAECDKQILPHQCTPPTANARQDGGVFFSINSAKDLETKKEYSEDGEYVCLTHAVNSATGNSHSQAIQISRDSTISFSINSAKDLDLKTKHRKNSKYDFLIEENNIVNGSSNSQMINKRKSDMSFSINAAKDFERKINEYGCLKDENSNSNSQNIPVGKVSMNLFYASPYNLKSDGMKFNSVAISRVNTNVDSQHSEKASHISQTKFTMAESLNGSLVHYLSPEKSIDPKREVTEENSECSKMVSNEKLKFPINDQKVAKCLPVRKVINLFQKESEEPVDNWPETEKMLKGSSLTSRKMFIENLLLEGPKSPEKHAVEDFDKPIAVQGANENKNNLISIKDRVKLFENDKTSRSPTLKIKSAATDRSTVSAKSFSTVSDKKLYWETFLQ